MRKLDIIFIIYNKMYYLRSATLAYTVPSEILVFTLPSAILAYVLSSLVVLLYYDKTNLY